MYNSTHQKAASEVCAKIAPLWPLKNYVAVNPYLGFTDRTFQETAKLMDSRAAIKMTLPLGFYLNQFKKRKIKQNHLEEALLENGQFKNVEEFIQEAQNKISEKDTDRRLKTVIDLAENSEELNQVMIDSISSWAAAYFDEFQAIWKDQSSGLFSNWLKDARIDRTPQLAGLQNFRKLASEISENHEEILEIIPSLLQLESNQLEAYFHTLLLKVSGWASYISGVDWNNNLYESSTQLLKEFLCILLVWEYATYMSLKEKGLEEKWQIEHLKFSDDYFCLTNEILDIELIFQDAFDRAHQEELVKKINSNKTNVDNTSQRIQSIFCIDVRSEIIRRNIERINPKIETIGFAGFFGFPIKYKETASSPGRNQCPVLIPSGPEVLQTLGHKTADVSFEKKKTINDQFSKTWKNFKSGAVSAFSFVSPLGIFYLPRLVKESFIIKKDKSTSSISVAPQLNLSQIKLEDKIDMAANALKLIGLKGRLSELVLIVGHGSTSTNNLHASGLDCGACGGHSGKENALTAAQILNNPEVRSGLIFRGIEIPKNTAFVAGLHDTTSDIIELYPSKTVLSSHEELLREAQHSFNEASSFARIERSVRFKELKKAEDKALSKRGEDWSQVRPEWGLAGCSSFIVGDRKLSKNVSFGGRAFLHNYNWKTDNGHTTLETIMTAPMVVTSWINLQYYASATDNNNFGAGNKTLHNVTGGIGVIEGSGGDLKTGLAFQSIHDGEKLQHLPNRLSVFIQAPVSVINKILEKHSNIQDLFDNNWISLFSVNDEGKVAHKYIANRNWEVLHEENIQRKAEQVKELQNI